MIFYCYLGWKEWLKAFWLLLTTVLLIYNVFLVVLPTFILERRSLLEMYSDFFAHADFYSNIPNGKTPRDRLIAVIKWYLTSFHAGRNGSVAKKVRYENHKYILKNDIQPYNPILGESFRCFWRPEPNPTSTDKNKKGPAPWSTESDVSFLAEQVSHHPPISAFYAENKSKSIQFTAHIWTKSKFLGMSIGVENEGCGTLGKFILPDPTRNVSSQILKLFIQNYWILTKLTKLIFLLVTVAQF